ncbi:MAG TPA: cytochrome C assembly protein, partial [Candidatus Marinimicrobia bacterium]|nr:cytochrome C assembly protein [Candidatus Neomarinimicrobiota bacterium]
MVWNIYNIIINTPMVPDQHWAQKIFYIHVPVAWTGFLSYFIVMVAGILYLINKEQKWDRLGLAAAEIGTLFVTLVLITGPIWAKPIWGTWWTWEPRLTTMLITFALYVA